MSDVQYQSLYRRFRPGTFGEVLGQEHVTTALKNAVSSGRVGHAYLFSGPRGTGKTSTARILAKALNCENLHPDGEPCGVCDSCIAVANGSSLDVHELDAASNNGVDAMRDLVSRAALSTPGRWKVYIIDEVHMLSPGASNALLKTLEEPPAHVVFVLATTDPQKVLPTIISRTQHFALRLIDQSHLESLVEKVNQDAGLDVSAEQVRAAIMSGRGSARDTLSALDRLAVLGEVVDVSDLSDTVAELADALFGSDSREALAKVAAIASSGRDLRVVASQLIAEIRDRFLESIAPERKAASQSQSSATGGGSAPDGDRARASLGAMVRAMEILGRCQVEMRDSVDPRVDFEVAVLKITAPEESMGKSAGPSPELVQRVAKLEKTIEDLSQQLQALSTRAAGSPPSIPISIPAAGRGRPSPDIHSLYGDGRVQQKGSGQSAIRPSGQGEVEGRVGGPVGDEPGSGPAGGVRTSGPALGVPGQSADVAGNVGGPEGTAVHGKLPDRDEMTLAWGESILASLQTKHRSRFKAGRFVAMEGPVATFALPNEVHRSFCEELAGEVQAAISRHFGAKITLKLVVDQDPSSKELTSDGPSLLSKAPDSLSGEGFSRKPAPNADEATGLAVGPDSGSGAESISASDPRVLRATPISDSVTEIEADELISEGDQLEKATNLVMKVFPGASEVDESVEGGR